MTRRPARPRVGRPLLLAASLTLGALVPRGAPLADDEPQQTAAEPPAPQGPVERVEVRGASEGAPLDPTAFATVIRAEDFVDRVTSVPELLREAVGVQVKSLGGQFATVSVRASSAEQVMVYLDGIPLNRALGGAVNLADLPLAQIESIEIYRGFTPASLPAASIGGAILIHTRQAEGKRTGTASASYGSFGTDEETASIAEAGDRLDYSVGADSNGSRGDFLYLDNNGTTFTPADDVVAHRLNNAFRRDHLSGRLTLRTGERARLSFSTDLLSSGQGVPGVGTSKSQVARFDTSRILLRSEIEAPGLLRGRLLLRAAADYGLTREAFGDPEGDVGLSGRPATDNRIGTLGQEAGLVLLAGSHQALSLLASARRETADLADHDLTGSPDLGTAIRDSAVATLEDQISLAEGRIVFNPSLRREAYGNRFEPGPSTGLVPDSLGQSEAHLDGKVGFRVRATSNLTVKGNFGRFLRLPEFTELFGDRGAVRGNPALLPERGRNADLGVAYSRDRPEAFLRQARVEGALFETVADDLIVFNPTPAQTVQAGNIDRARVRGIELSLDLVLGRRLTGSLNLTRQRAVDTSGGPSDGAILPGRPIDEATAGAGIELGRGRLTYTFTYVGPNFVDRENTPSEALPARYLHDLGYRVRLPRRLQATVEIKNLGDDRTYDVARFPLPGRSLTGRISWEF